MGCRRLHPDPGLCLPPGQLEGVGVSVWFCGFWVGTGKALIDGIGLTETYCGLLALHTHTHAHTVAQFSVTEPHKPREQLRQEQQYLFSKYKTSLRELHSVQPGASGVGEGAGWGSAQGQGAGGGG